MQKIALLVLLCCTTYIANAQDDLSAMLDNVKPNKQPVIATFKTTRLNMSHSIEMVAKHHLDFRVSHNFGAIGKTYNSDIHNFYGFDVASNIRLGFEYGVSDKIVVALGRSKGGGAVSELYDGHIKYKILRQTTDNKMPISMVLLAGTAISGMKASSDPTSSTSFTTLAERMSYATQLLIARKFGPNLSLQIMPTYIHRNYVASADENGIIAMGIGGRYKFSKRSAIILDYYYTPSKYRKWLNSTANSGTNRYYMPLGIGYELETGGHVFHMTLVNTPGFIEQDFIANSPTSWSKLGFRLGFNISRPFRVYHPKAKTDNPIPASSNK